MALPHSPFETKATSNSVIFPHRISIHPLSIFSPQFSFLEQWSGHCTWFLKGLFLYKPSVSHPSLSSQELWFSPLFCFPHHFLPFLFSINPLLLWWPFTLKTFLDPSLSPQGPPFFFSASHTRCSEHLLCKANPRHCCSVHPSFQLCSTPPPDAACVTG